MGHRISRARNRYAAGGARHRAAQRLVSSSYIRPVPVLCVFGLVALMVRELMAEHPVVDLRVLKNRTFSAGVFLITMLGFVLYASLMLLPLYLQTLMGYPAYNPAWRCRRAVSARCCSLRWPDTSPQIDPRRLLLRRHGARSLTMFQLSGLNLNAGFWDIFWPQILQGVALSFLFIPLMAISMLASA